MPTGTITAIRAQAHDSQRVNIFIDGEFAIGVSLAILAREQLAVGLPIDAEAWERLEAAEQADRAIHAAARLIDTRPRSVVEIRQLLRRKEHPPAAIEQAIGRLSELGLLDDSAFSRFWVENRRTFRQRGTLSLRDELRRKGVDRSTIEDALAEDDPAADTARAQALARRMFQRYAQAPDRASFQRRLGGMLQRRGFTLAIIRPILDQLWAELLAARAADIDEETP